MLDLQRSESRSEGRHYNNCIIAAQVGRSAFVYYSFIYGDLITESHFKKYTVIENFSRSELTKVMAEISTFQHLTTIN